MTMRLIRRALAAAALCVAFAGLATSEANANWSNCHVTSLAPLNYFLPAVCTFTAKCHHDYCPSYDEGMTLYAYFNPARGGSVKGVMTVTRYTDTGKVQRMPDFSCTAWAMPGDGTGFCDDRRRFVHAYEYGTYRVTCRAPALLVPVQNRRATLFCSFGGWRYQGW